MSRRWQWLCNLMDNTGLGIRVIFWHGCLYDIPIVFPVTVQFYLYDDR